MNDDTHTKSLSRMLQERNGALCESDAEALATRLLDLYLTLVQKPSEKNSTDVP